MSTLRTNALEGMDAKNSITIVAGAGNITTTNVQEGLAKQWAFYNQQTPAVGDSFNTGSITDNSTGDYTVNLTNAMSSTNYSATGTSIDIGSYYLATLLENYEGSYPFALAAYNAGPKRVKYWKKINGDPQKGKIDYINWIELIKFKETRNYVQRVLENVNVYRYILNNKPIKIYNFFEDKPHY